MGDTDMKYFDIYDKVYYNAENFQLETFPFVVGEAFDALVLGGEFIVDVNGTMLDMDYVDTVLAMFFKFTSEKDGIYIYTKIQDGYDSDELE